MNWKKKIAGVPVVLIVISIVAAGAAAAGYLVFEDETTTTVEETIEVEQIAEIGGPAYPGEDLGNSDKAAKYGITNTGPENLDMTVKIVKSKSNIDEKCTWYGIRLVPTSGFEGSDVMNTSAAPVMAKEGNTVSQATFNIGTVDYKGVPVNDYSSNDNITQDANTYWLYVEGELKDSVEPGELKATVQIFRGQ